MILRVMASAIPVALGALPALAASEAHGEHHAPSIATLLFPAINFTIFAFILWRYAWPAIRSTLADRRTRVEREMAEGETAHREASRALDEIRELRARTSEDAAALLADVRKEAETQRRALIDAARKTAERIERDAGILGAHEGQRAAHALRADIAGRIVDEAAGLVRERFGETEQRRAVADFLGGVSVGDSR